MSVWSDPDTDWGAVPDTPGIEAAGPNPLDPGTAAAIGHEAGSPAADEEPGLFYGSVDEFVREYLIHVYRRRIDGRHRCWAGEWWRYDEAVARLEALWRAWEHLRHDPHLGMSTWWRDHADHHMPVLMDPDGPFAAAIEGENNTSRRGEPLPYVAPPDGLFPSLSRQST